MANVILNLMLVSVYLATVSTWYMEGLELSDQLIVLTLTLDFCDIGFVYLFSSSTFPIMPIKSLESSTEINVNHLIVICKTSD